VGVKNREDGWKGEERMKTLKRHHPRHWKGQFLEAYDWSFCHIYDV
jgi:hypothetical protein